MQIFGFGATRERCRHNFRQLVFLKADIIARILADRQSPKNRVTKRPAIPIGDLSINKHFIPCSRHRHSKTSSFGFISPIAEQPQPVTTIAVGRRPGAPSP
jgi:hypothetical protein